MGSYAFLPHTADILMEVRGTTLPGLFSAAAEGMFSLLELEPDPQKPFIASLTVEGSDPESLLVNWLNDLLYLSFSQKTALSRFTIHHMEPLRLDASVEGFYTLPASRPRREIKAATYHGLNITNENDHYSARLIFDV